jgi:predicted MPP superfamily phosphohydrolase
MPAIQILVVSAVLLFVFGWPVWNLFRLHDKDKVLWLILPPALLASLFFLGSTFHEKEIYFWHELTWIPAFYWLVIGAMLFGFSVIFTALSKVLKIPKNKTFWLIVIFTILLATISRLHGERIIIREIEIGSREISRDYRFVHITDVHYGSTGKRHVARVVEKIKEINPEFVVITGDFIDSNFVVPEGVRPFADLSMPVFLVTGNHEYYLKEGKINEVIVGSNILLIDDQKIIFEDLEIIGVNELATIDDGFAMVGGANSDRYTIVLDHQPKTDEVHHASSLGADLLLAGHTHAGQIWPMGLLVKLQFKYLAGLYDIDDMFLYVNQGTGTLGPKMRFGTSNEITLVNLRNI